MKKFLQTVLGDLVHASLNVNSNTSIKPSARAARRKVGKFEQLEKRLAFAAELMPHFSTSSIGQPDPVMATSTQSESALPLPTSDAELAERASCDASLNQLVVPSVDVVSPQLIPSAQLAWNAAVAGANSLLSSLPQRNDYVDLMRIAFGGQGVDEFAFQQRVADLASELSGQGLAITVDLLSGFEMPTAMAAYASAGQAGGERIYVNADWLNSGVTPYEIEAVLLEELGHAIDRRLRGLSDSPGDEGKVFSASLRDAGVDAESSALLEAYRSLDDHGSIVIGSSIINVEFAQLGTAIFPRAYRVTAGVDKESNLHTFNFTNVGPISINDSRVDRLFSGNDVYTQLSGSSLTNFSGAAQTPLHGWISRPIKVGGDVVGFYFWSDVNFVDQAAAQNDGNNDADRNVADNYAYILVVNTGVSTFDALAFNSGSSTLKTIGSSSDRVDTALNKLLPPANVAPTAVADTAEAIEAGTATVALGGNLNVGTNPSGNVLTNDTDPDLTNGNGDSLRVNLAGVGTAPTSAVTAGSTSASNGTALTGRFGTLTIGADGSYSYVVDNTNTQVQALRLNANTLTDTFSYRVADNAALTSVGTVTVTIRGRNDAPVTVNDFNIAKNGGAAVSGDVELNDTDVDGNSETLTVSGLVATATIGTPGTTSTTLTFNSAATFNAVASGDIMYIQDDSPTVNTLYRVLDINGTIVSTTAKPSAAGGGYTVPLTGQPYSYLVGGVSRLIGTGNGRTVGFSGTSAASLTSGTTGLRTATLSASTTNQTIPVTSVSNGSVAVGMTISGTGVQSGTKVTAVTYTGGTLTSFQVDTTITSTSGTSLSFFGASGATAMTGRYGSLTLNSNGTYTYTATVEPAASPNNVDTFTYSLQDALGSTAQGTLSITVLPLATGPTANADTATAVEAGTAAAGNGGNSNSGTNPTGNVLTNDTTGTGTMSVTLVSSGVTAPTATGGSAITGRFGSLTIASTGAYTYTVSNSNATINALNTGGSVTDVFSYIVTNGTGTSTGKLTVTINGSNDAPVAGSDAGTVLAPGGVASSISSNVLSNDSDVDHAAANLSVSTVNSLAGNVGATVTGTYGSLVLAANGNWTYTIDANNAAVNNLQAGQTLSESFNYTVADSAGATGSSTLTITIGGAANQVSVSDVFVNESSPFAVFAVTGAAGIQVQLQLGTTADTTDRNATLSGTGADIGQQLQVYVSGAWTNYTAASLIAIPSSGQLLVRVAVNQDSEYESNEAFTLTATTQDSNAATGIGTINDEGDGSVFLATNGSANPNTSGDTNYPSPLDDDRTLSVTSTTVNEASPFAFFTVVAFQGQTISLGLSDGPSAPAASGGGVDYGSNGSDGKVNLQYLDTQAVGGPAWVTWSNPFLVPGTSVATSSFLVRTSITNDDPAVYEGAENFRLTASYVTGGAFSANGAGTVVDDGTGTIYNADGSENSSAAKDDDRRISVANLTVNEGSDYAIFTVTASAGLNVTLGLANASGGTGIADLRVASVLPTIQWWTGSAWTNYNGNFATIPAGGSMKVRISIVAEQDSPYEGPETFQLQVAAHSGPAVSATATATVVDDGTGTKYGPGPNDTSTSSLDDDRAVSATNINHVSNFFTSVSINLGLYVTAPAGSLQTATVDLDPSTPGTQSTLVVANQGTWSNLSSNLVGWIRFDPLPTLKEEPTPINYSVTLSGGTIVSNSASITIDYLPLTENDVVENVPANTMASVNVLANDTKGDSLNSATLRFQGRSVGESLFVNNQGTWSISGSSVRFTPESGFSGNPRPVRYVVNDFEGNTSNPATVSVSYAKEMQTFKPFLVRIDEGANGSFETYIVDNMPAGTTIAALGITTNAADTDSAVGRIYYSGSTSAFTSIKFGATSKPVLTSSFADITVKATVQGGASAGSIRIEAIDHDYEFASSNYVLSSPIGGTTQGSVSFSEFVSLSNSNFAASPNFTNDSGVLNTRSYSKTTVSSSFAAGGASLVSLGKSFVITHTAGRRITSFDAGGKLIDVAALSSVSTIADLGSSVGAADGTDLGAQHSQWIASPLAEYQEGRDLAMSRILASVTAPVATRTQSDEAIGLIPRTDDAVAEATQLLAIDFADSSSTVREWEDHVDSVFSDGFA